MTFYEVMCVFILMKVAVNQMCKSRGIAGSFIVFVVCWEVCGFCEELTTCSVEPYRVCV